jgi:tritrans,polycis-undecaprenyl-diphosphate synthase [geranylgeranyl-diphosphate specific]
MGSNTVPRHVAVIMDGNRRFSRRLMMKPWKGHEWGAKKLEQLMEWCRELGVQELTVYAFSVQNFERPKEEFEMLMKIFKEEVVKLRQKVAAGKVEGLRVVFIGRVGLFPEELQEQMRLLMDETCDNSRYRLNLAMGYGGREEVIDAVRHIGEAVARGELNVADINEEVFAKSLYIDSEPDLVIRTGGDHRTSNFLIWQSHYSEWFFVEKLWPEFEKEDFLRIISEYSARERRFGK